jgi:hypothetical protein
MKGSDLHYSVVDGMPFNYSFSSSNHAEYGEHTDNEDLKTWRVHPSIEQFVRRSHQLAQLKQDRAEEKARWEKDEDRDMEDPPFDIDKPDEDTIDAVNLLNDRNCYEDIDSWHPLMNYAWPLDGTWERNLTLPDIDDIDIDEPSSWLSDFLLSMTVVEINDEPYLAMTGGGMDMSWYLAKTYVNLGYVPPAHIDLPAFGESLTDSHLRAAAAMKLAYTCQIARAQRSLERLSENLGYMERKK